MRRLPEGARTALLLAPALSVVVVLFLGGFGFAVAQSLGWLPFIGQRTLSLDAYTALVDDPAVRASVVFTVRIAVGCTLLAALLAVAAGLLLRGTRRGRRLATAVFQLPLPVPHVVGATAMLLLLGQSGFAARLSDAAGLTEGTADFPALTADAVGWAIAAEYVWKETPFVGAVVLAALTAGGIGDLEDVGRVLGASWWQRLRWVTLPLLAPAVVSASIVVFAFTFGSYEVPFLLGRPYPAALPVVAYQSYVDVDLAARSTAMAIAVVISVVVGLLVLLALRLSRRWLRGLA